MSPLPQRRKTPEEIAKLRESLGIPDAAPPGPFAPPVPAAFSTSTPTPEPPPVEPEPEPAAETPAEPEPEEKAAPVEAVAPEVSDAGVSNPSAEPAESEDETPRLQVRQVRSLRRSEREAGPERPRRATSGGNLPVAKHSESELNEIRRVAALQVRNPAEHLKTLASHPVFVIFGYLLAFGGGVGGLIVAGFIWRKPRSRHHAAFIAVISLFVIVFGALYLFPQLRHAT